MKYVRFYRRVLLLFLLSINSLYGGTQQEEFLRACNLYKEKKYQEAYDLFDSYHYRDSTVWENMACCLYQEKQYENALLLLYKAYFSAGGSSIIRLYDRIEDIKKKHCLGDDWYARDFFYYVRYFLLSMQHHFYRVPCSLWQILSLVFFFFLLFFGAFLVRSQRFFILFSLLFFMSLSLLGWYYWQRRLHSVVALYTGHSEPMFLAPYGSILIKSALKKYDAVRIIKNSNDRCYVESSYAGRGWVLKDKLAIVSDTGLP